MLQYNRIEPQGAYTAYTVESRERQLQYEDHAQEDARVITDSVSAKVTRMREPFETLAEKYALAYPQQHADALQWYTEYIETLGAPFDVKTDDDIFAAIREPRNLRSTYAERVKAGLTERIDDERLEYILDIFSDIAYYRSPQIGFSAWACILFQFPKFAGIGHYWAGVFPHEEMRQLSDASVDDLRKFAPVCVSTTFDSNDFCAFVIGTRQPFTHAIMGQEASNCLRELEKLRIREDIDIALTTEGYSTEIRAVYHRFASTFWQWYRNADRESQDRSKLSIIDAPLQKQTSQMIREVESAYSKPELFKLNTISSELYQQRKNEKNRKHSPFSVVIAPHASYGQFLPLETIADLKSKVDSLTPNGPFMVAVTMALAIQNSEVNISLDEFITLLGLDPRSARERQDLRQKIWECIRLLAHTSTPGKLNGQYFDHNRKRIETNDMSPIIAITGVSYPREMGLGVDGVDVPVGVSYVAGAFYSQNRNNPQVFPYAGNIRALASIPPGQPSGKWARALALALFQYWRENAGNCIQKRVGEDSHVSIAFTKRTTRRDLFAHIRPDPNPFDILASNNPKNARKYWDQAEDLLKSEKIAIVVRKAEIIHRRQGWQDAWLDEELDIRPHPSNIQVIQSILKVFEGTKSFKKRSSERK